MSRIIALVVWIIQLAGIVQCQMPSFGFSTQYGTIAPHSPQMIRLITGHSMGINIYADWKVSGKAAWHHDYCGPSHRLDYFLLYTGNSQQLGYQHALTYQLGVPLDKQKNKQTLLLGVGPAYSSKKWDIETNRQGWVLGSHMNMTLVLNYQYHLLHIAAGTLSFGLRVTHLSNGAFTMPNAGTNNISLHLDWRVGQRQTVLNTAVKDSIPKWQWLTTACLGFKEIQPLISRKYPVFSLQNTWLFQVNRKSGFLTQLDFMANTSNTKIAEKESLSTPNASQILQVGIMAGYQLRFGKIGLFLQQGIYVINPFPFDDQLYHRFGLRTYWKRPWHVQLALKTHFAKADHGELGIGYTIFRRGIVTRGGIQ